MSFKGLKNMAGRARTLLVTLLVGNFFALAFAGGGGGGGTGGSSEDLRIDGILGLVCTIQEWMSGPIAIAIGILILAIGGLMIAFGGKRSIPFVVWGVIGVAIALAAPSIFQTLVPSAGDCEDQQRRLRNASITLELEELVANDALPFALQG